MAYRFQCLAFRLDLKKTHTLRAAEDRIVFFSQIIVIRHSRHVKKHKQDDDGRGDGGGYFAAPFLLDSKTN